MQLDWIFFIKWRDCSQDDISSLEIQEQSLHCAPLWLSWRSASGLRKSELLLLPTFIRKWYTEKCWWDNQNYHRFHFLTLLRSSSPSLKSFSFLLSLPDPPGCQTWCWSRWRRTWTPVRARTHSTFSPGGRWLHVCQNLTVHEKEEQENHEITLPGRPPSLCRSNKVSSLRIQRCRGLLRKEELEAWKPGTQWDLVIFCGFPGEAEAIMAKALLRDGNLWLGHLFGELFTLLSQLVPQIQA